MEIPLVGRPYAAVMNRFGSGRPFEGKLVLITGAGSGFGRATALAFADKGAQVIAVDIDLVAAQRTVEMAGELAGRSGTSGQAYQVDVSDAQAMETLATTVEKNHGVPDVVVNNAGIGMAGPFLATTLEDWQRVIGVNLWGVIHGCRLFAAQMAARGTGGHIVNMASMGAYTPSRATTAYSTTKAAVLMLSECMRADLAGSGIKVSAICPGIVPTNIINSTRFVGMDEDDAAQARAKTNRLYQLRHFSAEHVAREIVHAVQANKAVAPVSLEAKLTKGLGRLSPAALRLAARVDVLPH